MQVNLPGSYPGLRFAPCRNCPPGEGWQSGGLYDRADKNGTDSGFVTIAKETSIRLNFTGTGLSFDLSFAPTAGASGPGAGAGIDGGSSSWRTSVQVNGSAPPATATGTATGVMGLPLGTHEFSLALQRTDGNTGNETWAKLDAIKGVLGYVAGPDTKNTTIDDSDWQGGAISLSSGWSMMEAGPGGVNHTLSDSQLNDNAAVAGRTFNRSASWTEQTDAQTVIRFSGSAAWVYGFIGGNAGTFDVLLDGVTQGQYDASGGPAAYNQTLWHASGLQDGPHNVTLICKSGRLTYDRLVASSGFVDPSVSTATTTYGTLTGTQRTTAVVPTSLLAPMQPSAVKAAVASDTVSYGAIIGGAIGGIIGILALTLGAFLLWSRCRSRNKPSQSLDFDNNTPWYQRPFKRDKGWGFVNLDDPPAGKRGTWLSRADTTVSSSSFGTTAEPVHPPPAVMRKSFLPAFNFKKSPASTKSSATIRGVPPPDPSHLRGDRGAPSPDPMAFALGGAHSPLTTLTRSFSNSHGARAAGPPAITVDRANEPTGEWYNWFGLSTYGGRESMRSGITARSGGSGKPGKSMFGLGWGGWATGANAAGAAEAARPSEKDSYPMPPLGPISEVPPMRTRSPRRRNFDERA